MKKEDLEKIGKIIKEKREEAGFSIEYISNVLKINPTYLEAIENGEIDKFPAEIFLKGFLKNYAMFLKVDLKEFSDSTHEEGKKSENVGAQAPKKRKQKFNIHTGYLFLIGIVALIFFSWVRIEYVNRKLKTDFEKKQEAGFKTMTTAKEIALQEQKKQLLQMKETNGRNITIRVKEDCWIEIKDGDIKIFQGLLFGGEEREFPYKSGLRIKVGNAGVVEVDVRGKKMVGLGNKGEVKEITIE